MITTPNVTYVATTVDAGRRRRWLFLHNPNAFVVYLKFDGSATALTVANGFPLGPGQTLPLANTAGETEFFHDIWAMHNEGSEVTGTLRLQQDGE